jgi:hypothetical protein
MTFFLFARSGCLFIPPEIGLDNFRILAHLMGRAIGDQLAPMKHEQTLAEGKDRFHFVTYDDESLTLLVDSGNEVPDRLAQFGMNAGERLIEDDQVRVKHEDATQFK